MNIKSIRQAKKLAGKIVFLRLDLNAPIKKGKVADDHKLIMALPTLRFLLRHDCRLIVATHLSSEKATVKPIVKRLADLLDKNITLLKNPLAPEAKKAAQKMKNKDILFLENLRFNEEEEDNNKKFARRLAELADLYVNDAFAVCHREHASVCAIKKYLPSYAGLLIEKEIMNLEKILKPKQPLVFIAGGAKINTKIALLNNLAKKSYKVLIGGALANNFIAAHGFEIGKSLGDEDSVKTAAELIKKFKNIILPVDVITAKKPTADSGQPKSLSHIKKDDIILDIGPKTVKLFAHFIKRANTIIWNGPMGMFENDHFKHGTMALARIVAARSSGQAFGAAGGGETIEALDMTKMKQYVDWVSTGGGAMLAFLGGEKMPGLRGIVK